VTAFRYVALLIAATALEAEIVIAFWKRSSVDVRRRYRRYPRRWIFGAVIKESLKTKLSDCPFSGTVLSKPEELRAKTILARMSV
jgi:hypothetical protein